MDKLALHDILCGVLKKLFPDGEGRCYFEAPSDTQMIYPCIKYEYSNDLDTFADNRLYETSRRYAVTVIDYDPDSKIPGIIKELPYCTLDRAFVVDGLHHFVYTLYHNGPRIKEENKNV